MMGAGSGSEKTKPDSRLSGLLAETEGFEPSIQVYARMLP